MNSRSLPFRCSCALAAICLLGVGGCRKREDEDKKKQGEKEVQQLLDHMEQRQKRADELLKTHPGWSREDVESELFVQEGLQDKVQGTVDDICLAYRVAMTGGDRKEQAEWTMTKVFEVWGRVAKVEDEASASHVTLAGDDSAGRCRIRVTFAKQPGFRFDGAPGTRVGARCTGIATMDEQGVLHLGPVVVGGGEPVGGSCRRLQ